MNKITSLKVISKRGYRFTSNGSYPEQFYQFHIFISYESDSDCVETEEIYSKDAKQNAVCKDITEEK